MAFKFANIQPLVETVDRRGDSFLKGLGNAPVSDLAAGVRGLERGAAFGADLSAKIQQTKRINDPETLAARKLALDRSNEKMAEAIESARIKNKLDNEFGLREREGDLSEQAAIVNSSRALTVGRTLDNSIKRKTGLATSLAEIDRKRSVASLQNAQAREVSSKAEALDITNQFEVESGNLTARSEAFERINKNRSEDSSNAEAFEAEQLKFASEANDFEASQNLGKTLEERRALSMAATGQQLANKRFSDAIISDNVANAYYGKGNQATRDIDFQGNRGYTSGLESLASLSATHASAATPEEKQVRSAQITDIMKGLGKEGLEAHIADLPPEQQKIQRQIFSNAAARSNDTSLLSDDQKVLLGSGLSEKHIADPDATYAQVTELIAKGTKNIDDPVLKKALRSSSYVIAARKASKRGTQSYTIEGDKIEAASGGADVAGADKKSQEVITFTGEDGESFYAPVPQNEKQESELSLVEKTASRADKQLEQSAQARQQVGEIQQRSADANAPATRGKPVSTRAVPSLEAGIVNEGNKRSLATSAGLRKSTPGLDRRFEELLEKLQDAKFDKGLVFNSDEEKNVNEILDTSLSIAWTQLSAEQKKDFEDIARRANAESASRSRFGVSRQSKKAKDAFFDSVRPAVRKDLEGQVSRIAEDRRQAVSNKKSELRAEKRKARGPIAKVLLDNQIAKLDRNFKK